MTRKQRRQQRQAKHDARAGAVKMKKRIEQAKKAGAFNTVLNAFEKARYVDRPTRPHAFIPSRTVGSCAGCIYPEKHAIHTEDPYETDSIHGRSRNK